MREHVVTDVPNLALVKLAGLCRNRLSAWSNNKIKPHLHALTKSLEHGEEKGEESPWAGGRIDLATARLVTQRGRFESVTGRGLFWSRRIPPTHALTKSR